MDKSEQVAAMLNREISIRRTVEVCKHYADGYLKNISLSEHHRALAGGASMIVTPGQNGHTKDARTQNLEFSAQCQEAANQSLSMFMGACQALEDIMNPPKADPTDEMPIRPPLKLNKTSELDDKAGGVEGG